MNYLYTKLTIKQAINTNHLAATYLVVNALPTAGSDHYIADLSSVDFHPMLSLVDGALQAQLPVIAYHLMIGCYGDQGAGIFAGCIHASALALPEEGNYTKFTKSDALL